MIVWKQQPFNDIIEAATQLHGQFDCIIEFAYYKNDDDPYKVFYSEKDKVHKIIINIKSKMLHCLSSLALSVAFVICEQKNIEVSDTTLIEMAAAIQHRVRANREAKE